MDDVGLPGSDVSRERSNLTDQTRAGGPARGPVQVGRVCAARPPGERSVARADDCDAFPHSDLGHSQVRDIPGHTRVCGLGDVQDGNHGHKDERIDRAPQPEAAPELS
jgi:hypothetical protein